MALNLSEEIPPSVFQVHHQAFLNFTNGPGLAGLYSHQKEALLAISKAFHGGQPNDRNTALCVLATGTGKSGIVVLTPYILNSSRTLVLTPSLIISQQLKIAFGFGQPSEAFLVRTQLLIESKLSSVKPSIYSADRTREDLLSTYDSANLTIANVHKFADIKAFDSNFFDLVIVDEAHHYPAPTWRDVVDHFGNAKKVFLTATPYHNKKAILIDGSGKEIAPCYDLSSQKAINGKVIRPLRFKELSCPDEQKDAKVVRAIKKILLKHDQEDSDCTHKAMVLMRTKYDAKLFVEFAEQKGLPSMFFVGEDPQYKLKEFTEKDKKVLVVVARLMEGFDHKEISLVVILRNVARASRVLFTQVVGRAVRKNSINDPVTAVVLSHQSHHQQDNFDKLDLVPDEKEGELQDDLEDDQENIQKTPQGSKKRSRSKNDNKLPSPRVRRQNPSLDTREMDQDVAGESSTRKKAPKSTLEMSSPLPDAQKSHPKFVRSSE